MNKTQKEREEFLKKFNELVARMVNLEIIPNIQSQINERIPKQLGFTVYDGTELWNFVEKALAQREAEVRELLEDTLIDMDMSAEDTAYLDLAKDRINKFLSNLSIATIHCSFSGKTKRGRFICQLTLRNSG